MIAYMLLPVLATQLGGLVVIVRSPSADARGGIQHFAAGVIFVVRDTLGIGEVTLIFALRVVAMLLVRRLGPEPTPASPQQRFLPLGLLSMGYSLGPWLCCWGHGWEAPGPCHDD
jgi:hypothetical protein